MLIYTGIAINKVSTDMARNPSRFARVVAEERVTLCEIAGGNPRTYIGMLHEHGVKVCMEISSYDTYSYSPAHIS